MKALRFRVRNYRNIDDSGWVPLDRVTAFVGRNESGKTSLLKALNRFNPGTGERCDAQRDFPRDRYMGEYVARNSTGAEWPVCSIEFALSESVRADIATILGRDRDLPQTVTVTRHYDGSLAFSYAPAIADQPLRPDPLLDALGAVAPADGDGERTAMLAAWADAWRERLREAGDLRGPSGRGLLEALGRDIADLGETDGGVRFADLAETLAPMLRAPHGSRVGGHVDALVERHLPVLVYFESYGVLDSAIWLPEFLEGRRRDNPDARVRTADALFRLVGLDPQDIARPGDGAVRADEAGQRRMEDRSIRLNAASREISRRCAAMWSQRSHRIRLHADGDHFRIWVSDDVLEGVEIELESRGKGFQWFLSFVLVFLAETDGGLKDAILLLDEPGQSLHPTAQQELLAFLEHLSGQNQVLYTTHSPFLVDGRHLDRVRPVYEDETGHARILEGAWPRHRDTVFALRAAAGHALFAGVLDREAPVIVEDVSDVTYLQALSQQCSASGRSALGDATRIVPAGGAAAAACLASLFMAEHRRPVILFGGTDAARLSRHALVRALLDNGDAAIVLLDEALGWAGHDLSLEDVVGESIVLAGLERATGLALSPGSGERDNAGLVERIGAAGVDLPSSWRLSTALSIAESRVAFPAETLDLASRLFAILESRRRQR